MINSNLKTIFAERLRMLRKEKDLLQQDIALSLDIHKNVYQNYENSKTSNMPSYDTIIKISKFFDTSLDYLFGLTDQR